MLALRSIASRHFISTYHLPTVTHISSNIRCFSTGEFETGSVKFYNIGKAYGFITSDGGEDVFVHRTNIVGATDDDIKNPILVSDEKVQFCKETDENNKMFATKVKYEDGSTIPLYREDFVERRTKSVKNRLGFQVYDILSGGGDEITKADQIAEAYTSARDEIDTAFNKHAAQNKSVVDE